MPASRPERNGSPAARRRPTLRVALLGRFELTVDGVRRNIGKGARRIVALLALNRDGISRKRAAALLTPHLEPESARGSLRMELGRLRSRSPAGLIEDDGTDLRLAPHVTVDVEEVEALAASVARKTAPLPDTTVIERLSQELLPDWDDDWVRDERTGLRNLTLNALDEYARVLAEHGHRNAVLAITRRVLRREPLRESTVAVLIEMFLDQGNQAEVESAYLKFRARMKKEMGIEPSPQLRALVERVLKRC